MKTPTGNVFPRVLNQTLPFAEKAQGVWIQDTEGNRYLDASGGSIVVNVGHDKTEIARAVHDQMLRYHDVHPTMINDAFLVVPPFIITEEEMQLAVKTIRRGLEDLFPEK